MPIEVGEILEGVVVGITNFGAFIELPDKKVGLVHISEIADVYVNDINNHLKKKDKVKVKVLGVNKKGKYELSIKQAKVNEIIPTVPEKLAPKKEKFKKPKTTSLGKMSDSVELEKKSVEFSFEDKLAKYLKESEEKLLDLKRNTESKRGRRTSR